jgi:hypothetical protein
MVRSYKRSWRTGMWMAWLVTIVERHTDMRKSSAFISRRCYLPAHPFTMMHGDLFTMRAKIGRLTK